MLGIEGEASPLLLSWCHPELLTSGVEKREQPPIQRNYKKDRIFGKNGNFHFSEWLMGELCEEVYAEIVDSQQSFPMAEQKGFW
jgi:hypothetical protein